ncbi:MAG: ArsR/SmtB family transcription factor [Lachnospirales bacterium]
MKDKKFSDTLFYDLGDFFKIFGDSSRLKILFVLFKGEKGVSEIVDEVGMSQSAISHQLRILRQNDVVKFRKEGKNVIYSLDDEHVSILLEKGIEHILHKNGYEEV